MYCLPPLQNNILRLQHPQTAQHPTQSSRRHEDVPAFSGPVSSTSRTSPSRISNPERQGSDMQETIPHSNFDKPPPEAAVLLPLPLPLPPPLAAGPFLSLRAPPEAAAAPPLPAPAVAVLPRDCVGPSSAATSYRKGACQQKARAAGHLTEKSLMGRRASEAIHQRLRADSR